MLELTHLAMQPYTVKPTGETIPRVHIPPSKTDEERLIVASPELVHVLTSILSRLRRNQQEVPLTRRWDLHERVLGEPLPHLLVHHHNSNLHVVTPGTVHTWLNDLAARINLNLDGKPVHFTPHDFRRIFATEALANGIPPHIVQVLLGHRSLATTQGYTAIYPQDVIRAHRSFITTRRRTRPSEEYREPTPEEWAEFEAHFVRRKVSLGTDAATGPPASTNTPACAADSSAPTPPRPTGSATSSPTSSTALTRRNRTTGLARSKASRSASTPPISSWIRWIDRAPQSILGCPGYENAARSVGDLSRIGEPPRPRTTATLPGEPTHMIAITGDRPLSPADLPRWWKQSTRLSLRTSATGPSGSRNRPDQPARTVHRRQSDPGLRQPGSGDQHPTLRRDRLHRDRRRAGPTPAESPPSTKPNCIKALPTTSDHRLLSGDTHYLPGRRHRSAGQCS